MTPPEDDIDLLIVGAGFGGLYMLRRRDARERVFEVNRPVDALPKPEYLDAYMLIAAVRVPVWLAGGSRDRP
jgi:hypothetical protein